MPEAAEIGGRFRRKPSGKDARPGDHRACAAAVQLERGPSGQDRIRAAGGLRGGPGAPSIERCCREIPATSRRVVCGPVNEGDIGLNIAELLHAAESAPPVAAAEVVADLMGGAIDATDVSFLIADYSGRALVRLGHDAEACGARRQGPETAQRVPLQGSVQGRVLERQSIEIDHREGEVRVVAPVSNRGDAIGVLEVTLPTAPDKVTEAVITDAARALGYLVVANRRFTDLYEWGRRTVPLSLAAEIQHRLLPESFACQGGQFTLSGWLEPSGNVAGDTFDFTVERDTLHLSITDAMGHAVGASLLATVLVGALRNARRGGRSLTDQVRRANKDLVEHSGADGFVTGQVARIDLRGGTASIVNAGHVLPLRLRDGKVDALTLTAELPFGTFENTAYTAQPLPLEPGDRLIFLTDGILERNAKDVDLAARLVESASMHPREAVQYLTRAVLDAADGDLQDDATLMCLDWYGGPPRHTRGT